MRDLLRFGIGPALLAAVLVCGMLQGCYVTHTYDTVREAPEVGDIESLTVDVAVVAGEVRIGRAGGDRLYDLDLRFCESHFTPRISRADSDVSASLSVGLKRRRSVSQPPPGNERNRLDLDLSRDAPIDLVLDLGAGRHHAQLGGLHLQSLDLATGSGRVTIDFDRPTADELRLFRASVGPGGLRVGGLGYASPDLMSLSAGGGEFAIDLGGPWDKDGIVQLDVRLGDVTLIAPVNLGLMVVVEGREPDDLILPDFSRDERGDFRSPGFDAAKRRITVRCGRGLGVLRVEREN
jgi:hypothetical protein